MRKICSLQRVCPVLFFAALSLNPTQAYIVQDKFEDGLRLEYNPPHSIVYHMSDEAVSLDEVNGKLRFDSSYRNSFIAGSICQPGEYLHLEDGESLSLGFDFRLTGGTQEMGLLLRVAWINSGVRPGENPLFNFDGFEDVSYKYRDVKGYQAAIRPFEPKSGAPILLMKRTHSDERLLFPIENGDSAYQHLGEDGTGSIIPGELYTLQFNLRRVGNSVETTVIIVSVKDGRDYETEFFNYEVDEYDGIFQFDHFLLGLNAAEGRVDAIEIEELRIFKI